MNMRLIHVGVTGAVALAVSVQYGAFRSGVASAADALVTAAPVARPAATVPDATVPAVPAVAIPIRSAPVATARPTDSSAAALAPVRASVAAPPMVAFQKVLADHRTVKLVSHLAPEAELTGDFKGLLPHVDGKPVAGQDKLAVSDVVVESADGGSALIWGTILVPPTTAGVRSSGRPLPTGKDALFVGDGCWLAYVVGSQLNVAFLTPTEGMVGVKGVSRSVRGDTLGDVTLTPVAAADSALPANQVRLSISWSDSATDSSSVTYVASYDSAHGIALKPLQGQLPAAMERLLYTPSGPHGLPTAQATPATTNPSVTAATPNTTASPGDGAVASPAATNP
jgi:hypothetical protein